MEIRLAKESDLERILQIYVRARKYMIENGNPTQWGDGYPKEELLREDIAKEQLYVCVVDGTIEGVFVFIIGEDPTYARIDDGAWLNEETYGTLHRIAASGELRGMFRICMDFALGKVRNIRVDTHHDNHIMQHLAEKNGFVRCGIIYVRDGSPRIAYHYVCPCAER